MANINIKATNLTLTAPLEKYLYEKLEALEKFVDLNSDNVSAQVEIGKTTKHHQTGDDLFRAEINLSVHGEYLRAVGFAGDTFASIDVMKDHILDELRHWKEKKVDERRK